MSEPDSIAAEAPRWKAALLRLRKPVLVIAGIGTVLGGLAGYVTIYRTVAGNAPSASTTSPAAAAATEAISILVLPLANQTGDPAKAYMADGLTTAITGDLSRIQDAVIVPPVTAVTLHEKKLTLQQLGSEARVRFVLQGGVSVSGERLRVNAQLSDTRSGRQLWSQVFEAPLGDLFALQDDLTVRIRTGVGPQMVLLAAREAQTRENKPQVADLVLRLHALRLQQQSVAGLKQGEALARQALAIEPGSLRARAELAGNLWLLWSNFSAELGLSVAGRQALLDQAVAEAKQVLAGDPNDVMMHFVLSNDALQRGDFDAARKAYDRALEIDPRRASTYNNLGVMYRDLGQPERAREVLMKALQIPSYLPPADTFVVLSDVSRQQGAYDEAIEWGLKAVQASPGRAAMLARLALTYAMKGDERNARSVTAELLQRHPGFRLPLPGKPWPGREAAFRDYIDNKLKPAARLAGLPVAE